jgi:hypothetical protein
MAFNRARLDSLRAGIAAAVDELRGIRSDDDAATDAMRTISGACRTLGDVWLPRVQDILNSTAMTSCRRSAVGVADISQRLTLTYVPDPGWDQAADSPGVFGPQLPRVLSFDEVMSRIESGTLIPMAAPMDAQGRAGAHYTSIAFAPGADTPVGQADVTSNLLKALDFLSDGLAIGWREHKTLTVSYLTNVRVTSSVHVLSAYDRDEGPETLVDQTQEAIMSGYMIVMSDTGTAEVSVSIGPDTQDPTQSAELISETSTSYTGMFYPDSPPDFQPITHEPRFVGTPEWTFTKSSAPMVEGWGTWGR